MKLLYKKLMADSKIERNYENAGYDIWNPYGQTILYPKESTKIALGIKLEIPENYVFLLKGRSSLGSKGIDILAGVIDWSYRGELSAILYNSTEQIIKIQPEKAIVQGIMIYAPFIELEEVSELSTTKRNEKGFGSTDLQK